MFLSLGQNGWGGARGAARWHFVYLFLRYHHYWDLFPLLCVILLLPYWSFITNHSFLYRARCPRARATVPPR